MIRYYLIDTFHLNHSGWFQHLRPSIFPPWFSIYTTKFLLPAVWRFLHLYFNCKKWEIVMFYFIVNFITNFIVKYKFRFSFWNTQTKISFKTQKMQRHSHGKINIRRINKVHKQCDVFTYIPSFFQTWTQFKPLFPVAVQPYLSICSSTFQNKIMLNIQMKHIKVKTHLCFYIENIFFGKYFSSPLVCWHNFVQMF